MLSPQYLAAMLLALPFVAAAAPGPTTCLVVRIADGDKLTARCGAPCDYQQVEVRLAESDAPEKAQPFGVRSRAAVAVICVGEQPARCQTMSSRAALDMLRAPQRAKFSESQS